MFTLTFGEKVRVKGQPQPTLAFDLGGSEREARYHGLSDTDYVQGGPQPRPRPQAVKLHFAYTVKPGDRDDDGVEVGELSSAIRLGGAQIRSAATGVDANLSHAAVGPLSGHKVDGGTAEGPAGAGVTIIDTEGNPLELQANGKHRLVIRESTRGRYGLKLNTRPTHTVNLVGIQSDGDEDLRVLPTYTPLPIAPDEWETPMSVDIRATPDDDKKNGERVFLNRVHSKDPAYNDLILPDVLVVEDDDDVPVSLSVADAEATEGVDETLDFVVRLDPKTSRKVTVQYRTRNDTARAGSDYTQTSGTLVFAPGEDEQTVSVPITDDAVEDDGETFTLVLSNASGADFANNDNEAVGTIRNTETTARPDLTASFEGLPEAHDGERAFRFRVAFSEDIGISFQALREDAFTVSGGRVTGGKRVDDRRDLFEMTVEPDGGGDVTITLPAGRACEVSGAICTKGENRGQLTNTPAATVAGPSDDAPEPNTAASGAPTISGTPQVGEELTASTSGIADADGLDNAGFAYQWIRTDTDIQGATGSTYTAVDADEGKRLKVRVSFTDDAGHEESLTSAATDAVAAAPEPLTASFEGMPEAHDGESAFTFRVAFSEDIGISYQALREDAFTVTGGSVTRGRRVDDRRDLFEITVQPAGREAVTITLPAGRDCGTSGAICTKGDNRRPLTNSPSATVAGPLGIAVADARVEEGDGVVLAFAVTLSRAASERLTVDYTTEDGSAHAGDDYTAASGTLTFQAGESSQTIEVTVLDDAHDEGEETLTLTLSTPRRGG